MTYRRLGRILVGGMVATGGSTIAVACSSSSGSTKPLGDISGGDSSFLPDVTMGDDASDTGTPTEGGVTTCGDSGTGNVSRCSGLCTDLQTDVNNCGTCGHACGGAAGASASCVGGACVCNADAGSSMCGSTCVDTLTDPTNCGACHHVCQTTTMGACSQGACVPTVVASTGWPNIFGLAVNSQYVWWTQAASR